MVQNEWQQELRFKTHHIISLSIRYEMIIASYFLLIVQVVGAPDHGGDSDLATHSKPHSKSASINTSEIQMFLPNGEGRMDW